MPRVKNMPVRLFPQTEAYRDVICDYMPGLSICQNRKKGEWKDSIWQLESCATSGIYLVLTTAI